MVQVIKTRELWEDRDWCSLENRGSLLEELEFNLEAMEHISDSNHIRLTDGNLVYI